MEPRPVALVFGETLIDEHPGGRVVAGAPLHIAAHLADLGWRVLLVSRVGADADGQLILDTCSAFGIETGLVEVDPQHPTGISVVIHDPDGHRFEVGYPAAWDFIEGPEPVPDHDLLVFGSLSLRHPVSGAALQRILATRRGMRVFDLNLRPPWFDPEQVRQIAATVDLVKANTEEVGLVDGADTRAEWLCVTRGPAGAELRHAAGSRWKVDGIPRPVVDTVGAGDAFLAALAAGLATGADPGEALKAANRRAADTVTRRGGLPPSATSRPPVE